MGSSLRCEGPHEVGHPGYRNGQCLGCNCCPRAWSAAELYSEHYRCAGYGLTVTRRTVDLEKPSSCHTIEMSSIPHDLLGGREAVLAIANRFYDAMERDEPELTALHDCKAPGKVTDATRVRFGLFLVGWLGGEQEYMERFGHPRLRMRHREVPINEAMRDAWLRAMTTALDDSGVEGEVRAFLDQRFAEVADFLRNVP